MAAFVKLNPLEADILGHRLEAADCIADALTDWHEDEVPELLATYPDLLSWTRDVVENAALRLSAELGFVGGVTVADMLSVVILEDAMSGSTYFADLGDAVARGEVSKARAAALRRARRTLHAKLSAAAGGDLAPFPAEG
jgi:high-affinity K+ transport system ATPase subunit B